MTSHIGNFDTSTVVYGKFATYRPSTGATYTLGGTPALSVYKDNSTTQSTTGVTLTVDFDGVTGLNHFAIDTSADGTFYSSGSFFDIVITTGTVDGVSVTGAVVGSFTLNKTATTGIADAVWDEAISGHQTAGTTGRNLTLSGVIISETTAAGSPTTTTLPLTAGSATNDFYNDLEIVPVSGTLTGQARIITDYDGATKTITVDEPWTSAISAGDAVAIRSHHKHTQTQIADTLLDRTAGVETNRTVRQALRLMLAAMVGKVSGAATVTNTFRDTNDSKNRIVSTVDADGNRTAVTLDAS